jgi:hypothetical protein
MNATELASSSVDLTNSIVFSQGCHSGYSIVNNDAVPGVTQTVDWTEAFAEKKATLIAGTGYQYGDTDFLAYSAQLYADFSDALRLGTGAVAVGGALVDAKQTYLADTPNLQGIDIKSLLESTLYGLPMLSVNLPSGRGTPATSPSLVSSTTPFAADPGATLGLSFFDLALSPPLTTHTVQLEDQSGSTVGQPFATYLSGPDGVESNPSAPTLPLSSNDVSVAGNVLRGVGFRSGTYADSPGITPLTGAPATELNGVHSPFVSSAFFPSRLWTVNYFGGLTGGLTANSSTSLDLTPVQYESDAPGSLTDDQRTFSNVGLRLYYSANTGTFGTNVPALAASPTISRVDATTTGGTVNFSARVVGDPSAGIQQVWITYTGVDAGQWESVDLAQDPTDSTVWSGTLTKPSAADIAHLQFIVQAVNGVGLVSLDDNQGNYYTPDQIPPALQTSGVTRTATTLQLSAPSHGSYGSSASVSATLTGPGSAPVSGEQVTFAIGGSTLSAQTDGSGTASVQLPLVDVPGTYQLTAGFDGDSSYVGSSDSASFAIDKLPSTLALSGGPTATVGQDTGIAASLKNGVIGLSQRSVAFVLTPISPSGPPVIQTAITDLFGKASLGTVSQLTPGSYSVTAFFADSGSPLSLPADAVYHGSASGAVTLTVSGAPTVLSINRAGSSPTNAATVSWTVTFSQSVTGVSASNFSLAQTGVTGAGSIGVTGSGSVYTVTASTGTGDGTLGLSLSNTAGIPGLAGTLTGQTYTIDKTAPVVTLTKVNGAAVTFPYASKVNVTALAGTCSTASGDTASVSVSITGAATQSGTATCTAGAWSYTLSPALSGDGAYTLTATQADAAGNSGTSGSKSLSIDKTPPAVTLTKVNGAAVTFPYASKVNVTSIGGACGTASGDVATVKWSVAGGATQSGSTACSSGSWTVTLPTALSAEASYTLDATQVDALGNSGDSGNKTLTIDKTAPVVTLTKVNGTAVTFPYLSKVNVTSLGGTCGAASGDTATVNVSVTGAATQSGTATCSAGAWTYTPATALATEGAYTVTATQSDAAGNSGTSGAKSLSIDKTAPKVTSINLAGSNPTSATSVSWKVTFSETVTNVKAANFSLVQTGLPGAGGIAVTGSGAVYTVTASTGSGSGTLGLNLSTPAGIADTAGNALTTTFTGQVYTVAARLSSGTTTCNGIYTGAGANVTVPASGSCTLLPGTIVSGSVTVGTSATLSMQGVIVGGDVQATNAAGIGITASAIGHDIQISGTKSKGPGGADNFVCLTAVAHDLVVKNSASTASKFVIGGAPDCTGSNTVGHDVVVQGNQEAVVVAGNNAGHNVTVQGNTPGGAAVTNNTAGFDSACSGNSPQTGSGNKGTHSNTCPR